MIKISNLEEAANKPQWTPSAEIITYAFTNKNGKSDTIRIEFEYDAYGHRSGKTSMMVFYNNKHIDGLDRDNIGREEGIEDVRSYVEHNM